MANCLNYDCNDPLGDHMPNDCNEILDGGISAGILLECDSQLTDPTSAVQIAAEIAAGRATQVDNLMLSIEAASPIMVDGMTGCSPQKVSNYDRNGSLIDKNVSDNNIAFYNQVFGGRTLGGMILYLCGTADSTGGAKVLWVDSEVQLTGSLIVPAKNSEQQRFEGKVSWRAKGDPRMYAAPANIFT